MKDRVLQAVFVISKKPVLFRDLLEANSLYNEGMLVDGAKLNFRFNYKRTYQIYALICVMIFLPILLLTHHFLVKVDTHISIIGTAVVTSLIFIGFDMFKIWARKEISFRLIKDAWAVHFPYFGYEKYSKIVEEIYNQALKDDVSKKNLEQYVLNKLVAYKD